MQTRSSSYVTENPWGSQEASPTDAISLTSNGGGCGIATSGQQAPLPKLFLKDGRLPACASPPRLHLKLLGHSIHDPGVRTQ